MRPLIALAVTALSCAAARTDGAVTLRAPGETRQMQIAPDGRISGPVFQLQPTSGGYRGFGRGGNVDLGSAGDRIIGVAGGGIVDLRLQVQGDSVHATGLFAGQLGRLEASSDRIASWLGPCH